MEDVQAVQASLIRLIFLFLFLCKISASENFHISYCLRRKGS
jgi:hypothetical protein